MNSNDTEELIEVLLNKVPLETSFEVILSMFDIKNWKDGEYLGDHELIKRQVNGLVREVEDWVANKQINPIRNELK